MDEFTHKRGPNIDCRCRNCVELRQAVEEKLARKDRIPKLKSRYRTIKKWKPLEATDGYYLQRDLPIEHDLYQIMGINSMDPATFSNGFRFGQVSKDPKWAIIEACTKKSELCQSVKSTTQMGISEFTDMLWMIIERPNFELKYRITGLQGIIKGLKLNIDYNLVKRIKKRVLKHKARLANKNDNSLSSYSSGHDGNGSENQEEIEIEKENNTNNTNAASLTEDADRPAKSKTADTTTADILEDKQE